MRKIITINRQFGSGGREVGKRLADALQIAYYDKELISKIAVETHLAPNYIEKFEESVASRRYPITFGSSFSMSPLSPNDTIQIAQTKIIKELANIGDCVIVGRCADFILKEQDTLNIFIYSSDMNMRIQRCYDKSSADKETSKEQMRKEILAIDKQRGKYNSYYTGQDWQSMSNYNLCIDTSKFDIKKAVKLIVSAFEA